MVCDRISEARSQVVEAAYPAVMQLVLPTKNIWAVLSASLNLPERATVVFWFILAQDVQYKEHESLCEKL